MSTELNPLELLLATDTRYTLDAYSFVRDGLTYAVEVLEMGSDESEVRESDSEDLPIMSGSEAEHPELDNLELDNLELDNLELDNLELGNLENDDVEYTIDPKQERARHLTGQQLCEALRRFAVHQYGFMAKVVLAEWGIRETADFGNIVYNMINIGLMKKSAEDKRSHFDHVFDFDDAFEAQFQITQSASF